MALIVAAGFLKPNWRVPCFAFAAMWTVMIAIGRAVGPYLDGLDALQASQLTQETVAATIALICFLATVTNAKASD